MEELKIGTKRDLGEGFCVEVTRVCKDMQGHVDVVFSNGRRQLYLRNKDFGKSDFNDKRNSRVKDRTGETKTKGDGTKLTIINYVDCSNVDILVHYSDGTREILKNKNIAWFTSCLYEGVPYIIRKYGKNKAKKPEQKLALEGVIQAQSSSKKSSKKDTSKIRLENTVGKMYETTVGKALLVSCSRNGATVVDSKGEVHRLELEDISW